MRIYDLGHQSFWIDESYSATAAIGMIKHLIPYMPSGQTYSRAILNTGLIALSMKIFGTSEFSARLPSVFFGVLTIIVSYLFFRKIFGQKIGLATAFIVAFSVIEIAWSRQARMYQQLQFFYLLSLYIFYKYVNTSKLKFGILTVFSVICTVLSHTLGLSLLIVFPIYYFLSNFKNLANVKQLLNKKTLMIISIFLIALFLSQHFFNSITHVFKTRVNLLTRYFNYFKAFFPIMSYLSVIGVLVCVGQKRKKCLLPILALIIPLYFIFFHEKLLGYRYVFFVLPLMFAFFVNALDYVSKIISKDKVFQTIILIVLLGLFSFTSALNFVPKQMYYLEPRAPQPDFKVVYEYLQQNSSQNDTLVVSYPEIALWFNQTPDYWLAFSISGFSASRWMDDGNYKLTSTPAIKDFNELQQVYFNSSKGWLVLDSLSKHRISDEYLDFIQENMDLVEDVSRKGKAGEINLYYWQN